jgi:hypothetical protein
MGVRQNADDSEELDVENFSLPDGSGFADPYAAEIWNAAVKELQGTVEESGAGQPLEKAEGQPCVQGETAASSGCIPAAGDVSPEPSHDSDSARKSKLVKAFRAAASKYADTKTTAGRFGKAGFDKLPESAQSALANTYGGVRYVEHKLMSGYAGSKKLAEKVAAERGWKGRKAELLVKGLGIADLVMGWTVQAPLIYAATGSVTAAKVGTWIPVASLGFVGYSFLRNPFKTVRAAKALITGSKAKAYRGRKKLAQMLADGIDKGGEQFLALFSAALDAGDKPQAAAQRAVQLLPKLSVEDGELEIADTETLTV